MHISSSQRSITNADGNKPVVALYERATKALPPLPLFIRSLSDAPLFISIERITAELGYDLKAGRFANHGIKDLRSWRR